MQIKIEAWHLSHNNKYRMQKTGFSYLLMSTSKVKIKIDLHIPISLGSTGGHEKRKKKRTGKGK